MISIFNIVNLLILFLEFSLDEYRQLRRKLRRLPEDSGKANILGILLKDKEYRYCLNRPLKRYQLRKAGVRMLRNSVRPGPW